MFDMTIKARIVLLGALAICAVALSGGFGIFQLSRFNDKLAAGMSDIRSGVGVLVDVQSANSDFKTQVQEWKNILIRGNKDGEFEKYEKQFQSAELAVQERLRKTQEALRTLNDPTQEWAIEVVAKLLKDHAELGMAYRTALLAYDKADPEAGKKVDEAVRGLDRETTEGMRNLAQSFEENELEHLQEQVEASQSAYLSARNLLLSLIALAFLLSGGVVVLTVRQVSARISAVQDATEAVRTSLDLKRRIAVRGKDEMARVANSVDALLAEFHTVVRRMKDAGSDVSVASDELSRSVTQLTSSIEQQNEATSSMAASIEEMAVSVTHVSESSASAKSIAQKSLSSAEEGRIVIDTTATQMVDMAQTVQKTSHSVEELNQRTDEIGSIVNVIKDIAEQTNLLALNAAIEAARAGEQGRGFAVVADEVRKLAERTTSSTKEVADVISAIQAQTRQVVDEMHRIVDQVSENATGARSAGESMSQIRDGSFHVVEVSTDIATALSEQSAASDLIAQKVEVISSMSEENTTAMLEVRTSTDEMKRLSSEMHELVGRFQV